MERPCVGAQLAILASEPSKARPQNESSDYFSLQVFPAGASDFMEQRQATPDVSCPNSSPREFMSHSKVVVILYL